MMSASTARSASLEPGHRTDLPRMLDRMRARIEAHFAEACRRTSDDLFRTVLSSAATTSAGGKLLRPRLVLAAYDAFSPAQSFSGVPESTSAVDLALAFELLHLSFLHHDDVIDHDLIRRGRPNLIALMRAHGEHLGMDAAAAAEYANVCALLAGDRILSDAHRLVAEISATDQIRHRLLGIVADAVEAAIEGEHADVIGGLLRDGDEEAALRIMDLKTARYSFSAPLEAGAVLAGAPESTVSAMVRIGDLMGRAFQMRDDLLGVFGTEQLTGKSALSDLREGKLTLLIAYARRHPHWQRLHALFGDRALDEAGAQALRSAIIDSGARAQVERILAQTISYALTALDDATLPPPLDGQIRGVITEIAEPLR